MDPPIHALENHIHTLKQQIQATEFQLRNLQDQLRQAEDHAHQTRQMHIAYQGGFPAEWIGETLTALHQDGGMEDLACRIRQDDTVRPPRRWPLEDHEYRRYGRQLIMPEVGLHGQLRLKNAKVLIVGVGGLGCPAAAYLAGAGVGTIGLLDGDTVDESNLHRQIAHATTRIGMKKVDSAGDFLAALNPNVNYIRYPFHLEPTQALSIFDQFDVILDCTDHPTSRYLISDASVLSGKPLISASALKTDGQLIVLNNPPKPPGDVSGGPCYRCIFPKPPPADSVLSCGEGGILGPVVGVMGVLQALETIKLLTSPKPPPSTTSTPIPTTTKTAQHDLERPTLLIFSCVTTPPFRSIRMRTRHKTCATCSAQNTITRRSLTANTIDYVAFCGTTLQNADTQLFPHHRISAREFAWVPRDGSNMLIDVRDETQFAICALRGSVNVPWRGDVAEWVGRAVEVGVLPRKGGGKGVDGRGEEKQSEGVKERYVVCRFGNDSQLVTKALVDEIGEGGDVVVKDIKGGFRAWREEVDPEWPDY